LLTQIQCYDPIMGRKRKYADLAHLSAEEYRLQSGRRRYGEWAAANPEKAKRQGRKQDRDKGYWRQLRYGVTPEQYAEMLKKQNDACAVCENPFEQEPFVDHCHETGRVRGLLCRHCNTGIGMLKDDPALMRKAALYVEG
jgi:hypothetical protein